MTKRPVEERGISPPVKRKRSSSPTIHNLLHSLVSQDARLRSVSIAGLTSIHTNEAEQIELVRAALEHQLWLQQDPFLVQQLVKALVHQCGKQSSPQTTSLLQRCYISDACSSDSSKLCIISWLHRFSESLELLKPVESKMLQDGERENPMVRLWVMKLLFKCYQRQQRQEYLVSEVLGKKFFDLHEVVRGFALEAAISLDKLGNKSLEIFHSSGLRLLQDGSESVRISAMKLLHCWVTKIQALNEDQATEKQINHLYLLVCTMITDSSMHIRKEACHLLGATTSASSKVKLHSLNKKTSQLVKDDPSVGDAPVSMAAGAFVSAVEDEFPEVRCAAIQALTSLSLHFAELLSSGVLALFLDLLNDQHVGVRMETLGALRRLAERGLLRLQQKQLLVVCDVLKDRIEVRNFGRKLLSCMKLPTVTEFNFVVQSLLNTLEQHPEENEDTFRSLLSLGDAHAAHVEALTLDFANQIKLMRKGEKGLDDPKVMALLNVCRGSIRSKSFIFPGFSPDVVSFNIPQEEKLIFDNKPELRIVMQRALLANPRSEDGLKVLSACRKALAVLESSPQVNLGILYLESLTLVAKLKLFTDKDDELLQRHLAVKLRSMHTRFSGFTDTGSLLLLELKLFAALMQSSTPEHHHVAAIVNESRRYSSSEQFLLLKLAGEKLESSSSEPDRMKALVEAARSSFWPEHDVCCSEIEEMRGYLRVPSSDFEHRLKFIPGFPFQVKVSGEVKHMRAGCRVWIEMGFEFLPCQYSFLTNTGSEGSLVIAEVVTFHSMPVVSSGSFRVRIVAELLEPENRVCERRRGAQASFVVPVSDQQVLYLQADII